jgi:hypothetical protein
MERVDLLAIPGHERQVEMGRLLIGLEDAQGSLAVRAQLDTGRSLRKHRHPDRFECLEEEGFARCIVADSEYNVVEHGFSSNVLDDAAPDALTTGSGLSRLTPPHDRACAEARLA